MEGRKLIAHVVGARPNYMKIAPVYSALSRVDAIDQFLIHTGQHYDTLLKDVFLAELLLPKPHVDLQVGSGSHAEQTARALIGLERTFIDMSPDLVIVAGDVNSTLAGALAAAKLEIPICHVESGLRSFDWSMPEEHNRRLTDHVSTLLLTHSESANDNLTSEGIPTERIAFVGNTMIDSLLACVENARELAAWSDYGLREKGYILVTLHRPSLVDSPDLLAETLAALASVAHHMPVLFPVHPRTEQQIGTHSIDRGAVTLTAPLPYSRFVSLELGAAAVITDSGGVQEETTALGVRCFTLRDNTERPVTVTHGTNTVLGLIPSRILEVPDLLSAPLNDSRPALWDGKAGDRAATEIENVLELR